MIFQLVRLENYTNRYLEFLRIYAKVNVSIKDLSVCANYPKLEDYYPKSLLRISAHVPKISTSLLRFGAPVSAQNTTVMHRMRPRI